MRKPSGIRTGSAAALPPDQHEHVGRTHPNGNLGTIEKVDRPHHAMTVTLDSGKSVRVPLERYVKLFQQSN
jgi:hypothetical protein